MPTKLYPPTWLDTQAYPFAPHYFDIEGQQLHYIDQGQGPVLIFVHGTPSWSFDYRQLIQALSSQYRCIALDHIGFGLSDKPQHFDYSTPAHARRLSALIAHLGLDNYTLIMHDFGGVIGMDHAIRQPDQIHKIVMFNSWLWSAEQDPDYQRFKRILRSPLLPWLYRWLNFSARFLLPQSFGDRSKLSKAVHKQYLAPFGSRKEREGTLAFAHSLLHDQAWFQSLWEQLACLSHKPILFVWGMRDSFVRPSHLARYRSAFAQPSVVELPNCGHFPQEEEPEAVLQALRQFLALA